MTFATDFDNFACIGDSITCEFEGITYTAFVVADSDTSPRDYDAPGWCFDTTSEQYGVANAELIAAWERDEWHYCGIVISAAVGDVELGEFGSLFGVELNMPTPAEARRNLHLRSVANDLLDAAMEGATARRKAMLAQLAA